MRTRCVILAVILVIAALPCRMAAVAQAPGFTSDGLYQIELIAKSGDVVNGKTLLRINNSTHGLDVNDHGDIVYIAYFEGGVGVFKNKEALFTTDSPISGKPFISIDQALITGTGHVAFRGVYRTGDCILCRRWSVVVGEEIVLETGQQVDDGRRIDKILDFDLNDSGQIVAQITLDDGLGALISNDRKVLVNPNDNIGGVTILTIEGASINNSGTIAFYTTSYSSTEDQYHICTLNGCPFADKLLIKAGKPIINNSGQFVFTLGLRVRTPGGANEQVVSSPDGTPIYDINDAGAVYSGSVMNYDGSNRQFLSAITPVWKQVVGDEEITRNHSLVGGRINNRGQIAYMIEYATGRMMIDMKQAIILATPAPLPDDLPIEPVYFLEKLIVGGAIIKGATVVSSAMRPIILSWYESWATTGNYNRIASINESNRSLTGEAINIIDKLVQIIESQDNEIPSEYTWSNIENHVKVWYESIQILEDFNKDNVNVTSAESSNLNHIIEGGRRPYAAETVVYEITTDKPVSFVRVHGVDNQVRSWLMPISEIEGLSAEEIKDKYALPQIPIYMSDVTVPKGTNIKVGIVAGKGDWGGGGGLQIELMDIISETSYSNMRPLE